MATEIDRIAAKENALVDQLENNKWPSMVTAAAGNDAFLHKDNTEYIEFYSPAEQRAVRLMTIHQHLLEDAETGERFTVGAWDEPTPPPADHDSGDDPPDYFYEPPHITESDDAKLCERYGCQSNVFLSGPTLFKFGQPPAPLDLEMRLHGLRTLDTIKTLLQNDTPREIIVRDDLIPPTLKASLLKHVYEFRDSKEPDWHPGSRDMVNDIIHPIMYPFVDEGKPDMGDADLVDEPEGADLHPRSNSKRPRTKTGEDSEEPRVDAFGRKYREGRYQSLPTDFYVDDNKQATVAEGSYINNMPACGFDSLVHDLEALISLCLPSFEEIWKYVRTANWTYWEDPYEIDEEEYDVSPHQSLNGRTIQVVPKIAEYVFREKGSYFEGVWHFEGLPHEHILGTAVYFPKMDRNIEGGELEFKRCMTPVEVTRMAYAMRQSPHTGFYRFSEEFIPLGRVQTQEDRFLMFPNSHAHKLSPLINTSASESRRVLVVLFFIDPAHRIQSTTGLPRREERMTFETAKEIRLKMMEERRAYKQDLHSREIEFCEH